MSETQKKGMPELARLVVVLLVITAVVAALLGVVDMVTRDKIAANEEETLQAALQMLIPGAEFTEVPVDPALDTYAATPGVVSNVYEASGDQGYCVKVAPSGFGAAIQMLVGVNADGTVAGIQILTMSETPGLGAKASEPEFAGQFEGAAADGTLQVSKDGGTINAITGATITSRAVTNGVDAACTYVANLEGGAA